MLSLYRILREIAINTSLRNTNNTVSAVVCVGLVVYGLAPNTINRLRELVVLDTIRYRAAPRSQYGSCERRY